MLLYAAKSSLMHHYSNIKKINTKIKRKKIGKWCRKKYVTCSSTIRFKSTDEMNASLINLENLWAKYFWHVIENTTGVGLKYLIIVLMKKEFWEQFRIKNNWKIFFYYFKNIYFGITSWGGYIQYREYVMVDWLLAKRRNLYFTYALQNF